MQAVVDTLGQPVPIGEVMKQQEEASRKSSAEMVGKSGASKLDKQADAAAASEASAASAASAAAAASGAPAESREHVGEHQHHDQERAEAAGAALRHRLDGEGHLQQDRRCRAAARSAACSRLQDAKRPFPVQADVKIGDTHIALVGTVTDPAHLAALDLRLWLQGVSMAHLYPLTGVTLPETPPYATEGRLVGQFREDGNVFKYENFTGRVGGSDLNGSLVYAGRKPRPLLSGRTGVASAAVLRSRADHRRRFQREQGQARRGRTSQPSNKALPTEEFKTDRWKAIDADVKFTGRRIIKDPDLPITDLYTHVVMTDGVLSLEPLKFGVAGGSLASNIHLDGSTAPLKGRVSTQARHLKLKQLFPNVKTMQTALGEVNGDAALSATGNSPAALAATSNGEVKALITDGTVSRLLYGSGRAERGERRVREAVRQARREDQLRGGGFRRDQRRARFTRVRARYRRRGDQHRRPHQSARPRTMDLGIHPHTKGFRVFSLRSPLYVKGTFKDPHVGVSAGALAVRGAAAVGLGLINPFAALIPLIAPSNNKPLPCTQMLADIRSAPSAPPAGQKQQAKAAPAYMSSDAAAAPHRRPRRRASPSPASAAQYRGS